jgi:hypothetical protein
LIERLNREWEKERRIGIEKRKKWRMTDGLEERKRKRKIDRKEKDSTRD